MDFRTPYLVGARIDEPTDQLTWARGYDHTYILNKEEERTGFLCPLQIPKTGIIMETYTTQPGVQLYTGNWMTGNFEGKNGQRYPARAALCLETQHFPRQSEQTGISVDRTSSGRSLRKQDLSINSQPNNK